MAGMSGDRPFLTLCHKAKQRVEWYAKILVYIKCIMAGQTEVQNQGASGGKCPGSRTTICIERGEFALADKQSVAVNVDLVHLA